MAKRPSFIPVRRKPIDLVYQNIGRSKRPAEKTSWMSGPKVMPLINTDEQSAKDKVTETVLDRAKDSAQDAAIQAARLTESQGEVKATLNALREASKDLIAGRHIRSSLAIIGTTLAGGVAGAFGGLFFGGVGAIPGALAGAALGASAGRRVASATFPDEQYYDVSLSKTEPITEHEGWDPETINLLSAYIYNRAQATKSENTKKALMKMLNEGVEKGNVYELYRAVEFLKNEYEMLGGTLLGDSHYMMAMINQVYGQDARPIADRYSKLIENKETNPNEILQLYNEMHQYLNNQIKAKKSSLSKLSLFNGKDRKNRDQILNEIKALQKKKKMLSVSQASDFLVLNQILTGIAINTKNPALNQDVTDVMSNVRKKMDPKVNVREEQIASSKPTDQVMKFKTPNKAVKLFKLNFNEGSKLANFDIFKDDMIRFYSTPERKLSNLYQKSDLKYTFDVEDNILTLFNKENRKTLYLMIDEDMNLSVLCPSNDFDMEAIKEALRYFEFQKKPLPYRLESNLSNEAMKKAIHDQNPPKENKYQKKKSFSWESKINKESADNDHIQKDQVQNKSKRWFRF